jgi:hypothetical protein
MRKLVFICLTAALVVPAFAAAGARPGAGDRAAAAAQCSSERTVMGAPAFKLLYGTTANRSNAFGKCVSKLASQNAQNHATAVSECRAERAADPSAFAAQYGTGPNHANAFGKCVSGKAKAQAAHQQQATVNAARQCWTERQADPAAFKTHYGTNASKSNAFGKCVSSKVKHSLVD